MNDLFEWSVAFPGIDLVELPVKNGFIKFVQDNYASKLKQLYETRTMQLFSCPKQVKVLLGTNKKELYDEIKRTPEYIELQDTIESTFFDTQKDNLITCVSTEIKGFDWATLETQTKFVKALISDFSDTLLLSPPATMSMASFNTYIKTIDILTIQGLVSYLPLQKEMTQHFFSTNKEKLITVVSKTIPGFILVPEAEQKRFILDLLPFFVQECIEYRRELNDALFLSYTKYLIKNKRLEEKYLAERNRLQAHYIRLYALIEKNMLKALRNALGFLFPLPCKDEKLKALFYIFDLNLDVQTRITRLIQYFNDIYQQGKILIENGYQEDAVQETQSWVTWGMQSLLAIPGVRDIGAAVGILTRAGILHEGNGGIVAEVGNAILVADHAQTAGHIRKLLHTIYLPLQPLAREWFVILPTETNWMKIALRFLMPILVASIIIALGFLLISSIVSMPAVFELLMIVPLTYLGFVVASGLISLRDFTYESIRNWVYNGQYNTPEYQVNTTLTTAFDKDTAKIIRNYYVDELQKCDKVTRYSAQIHQIALTPEIIAYLQANGSVRKQSLLAEWSLLTGASRIEKTNVLTSHKLLKKRVKLDSTNQTDLLKSERDEYLKEYCQTLRTCSNSNAFFQEERLRELKERHKPNREKLNKLQAIHHALSPTQ